MQAGSGGAPQSPTPPSALQTLAPGEVQLWLARCDALAGDAALAATCQRLMNADEAARGARYHFEADRQAHRMARALLRCTLSRFAAVAPQDWCFQFNAQGKPALAEGHARQAPGLQFNLSHTRRWVVLAIAQGRALGVDVEAWRPQLDLALADRFFHPQEAAALHRLPAAEQPTRFVELWTLKESFIKAQGRGLSMALDSFCFELDRPGGIELALAPELQDRAERWAFMQWALDDQHRLALCAEQDGQPLTVRLLHGLPLGSASLAALAADVPGSRRSTGGFSGRG